MSASSLCLSCLKRSLIGIERPRSGLAGSRALSTTPSRAAQPVKKKVGTGKPQQQRGKTLRINKKKRVVTTGRPPAPGERKALRKRVVLSNTNALEVEGLQDLTAENVGSDAIASLRGKVLGFSNETVDALRALEAFKPTQGWSLFRRPATLIRTDTVELAQLLDRAGKQAVVRETLFGERGSGKSVLQLQGLAMAWMKGWIVIHIPEAQELTNAHTSYEPEKIGDETQYFQSRYTAQLLGNVVKANRNVLSTLRLSKQHSLPVPIQENISLDRFAEMGARDPEVAWPIWQALWNEITAPSQEQGEGLHRPPVFFSMDGIDHVMRNSAYLDPDSKPIHAHDLALVRQFTKCLSGQINFPNGGAVIAAISESNRAASPTVDYLLHATAASGRVRSYDPYGPWDERVASLFEVGKQNDIATDDAVKKDVDASSEISPDLNKLIAKRVRGLSKEEAKGIMEYYAQSGILRASVTHGLVSEKWTLSGGGIFGELERDAVRMRF